MGNGVYSGGVGGVVWGMGCIVWGMGCVTSVGGGGVVLGWGV